MLEYHREFRFKALLICLVVLLISLPIITISDTLEYLIGSIYSISLLLTVYVLAENKKLLILGLLLAIPSFIINLTDIIIINKIVTFNIRLISQLCVDSFVILFLLNYIFKTKRVTPNILFASVCIYLLLGVAWSIAYTMVELNIPGSFAGVKSISTFRGIDSAMDHYLSTFIYFSYITLTTLGYGNIYPLNATGNALAATEAVVGQLYIALLIGRLLGMHIAQRNGDSNK